MLPTLQEILQPRTVERRAIGRTKINRGVLMYFTGKEGVHACNVRDVTNRALAFGLNGLNIVASKFSISFDNFRTTRECRMIWRDNDFLGAAFES